MISAEHFIATMPWYLQVLATAMTLLLLAFVVWFLIRGLILWYTLFAVGKRLRGFAVGASPDDLKAAFPARAKLAHLWHEYTEMLHAQHENGTVTWRATGPSEAYFNAENIVDAYTGSEFFRHLPGVFTGMGIIGTFAGLISGLKGFRPTTDPAQTMTMIGPLIGAVREAFYVSAAAITAAMVITLLEKFIIAVLYGRTAKVANGIDRIFDAGIGEEYLERLTKAAEEGTSQAKMLKDALVKDISEILQEVTRKQTEGISVAQKELGAVLSTAIQTGLTEPLNRMEQSFKTMTGGTGERTVQMLGDVMASFSAKLSDLFGGQISGINELNKRSAEAMQSAAASLRELVDELGRKGKEATDHMAQKMAEAINAMELRQSDINNRTEVALEKVAESMRGLMDAMGESVNRTLAGSREREAALVQRSTDVVTGLGSQVDKAVVQMSEASQAMARSVEKLSGTTTYAIDKMNLGADKIAHSADSLTAAAAGVDEVIGRAHELGKDLSGHSQQLLEGSRALQSTLADYQEQRRATQQLIAEAGAIVDAARKEASITEDVLKRIEQSAQGLAHVHADFDQYLDGINTVLAGSNDAFRNAVTSTLREVNNEFHQDLGRAVKLLGNAIEELETTLADAPRSVVA
jgi:methyl-accepting chemotaxis protein